jgi:hypothetical protein
VWLWLERIPEEDQDVELPLDDLGTNLLIASERTALDPLVPKGSMVDRDRLPCGAWTATRA